MSLTQCAPTSATLGLNWPLQDGQSHIINRQNVSLHGRSAHWLQQQDSFVVPHRIVLRIFCLLLTRLLQMLLARLQYRKTLLVQMLGLSFFFYEVQRAGPLPSTTRAPWRGDSLKSPNGGNLDGKQFQGGYFDAGDHNKFQLPTAYAVARLNWLAHAFPKALESTYFDVRIHSLQSCSLRSFQYSFEKGVESLRLQQKVTGTGVQGRWNRKWAREAAKWGADFMARSVEEEQVLLHIGDIRADHNYIGRAEYYPDIDRNILFCPSGACLLDAHSQGCLIVLYQEYQGRCYGKTVSLKRSSDHIILPLATIMAV